MGNRYLSPEVRFWSHVQKSNEPDGCWEWTGCKHSFGYGVITVNYKYVGSHRFSYELHIGPIAAGMCVCHKCDNPSCVRPDHLFLGTMSENSLDRHAKGRTVYVPPKDRARGERHGRSKLTWEQVDLMRASGMSKQELSKKFNISLTNVYDILNWRIWRKPNSPPAVWRGKTKLVQADVDEIRRLRALGTPLKEISVRFNITQGHVSEIASYKAWEECINLGGP